MAGLLLGLVAGFMGGLVGVGGGVIMTPLMTEILKFRQQEAHGTSLVAVVFTALAASVIYYLHGSVNIPFAILLAGLALCTVRLGARYCSALPEYKLKRYFGMLLLLVAVLLFAKPYLPHLVDESSPAWMRWSLLAIIGLLTGFISGMMGVGGGIFMVPMMVLFVGISQVTAQGISLFAMIPASVLGAWTHWKMGNTRKELIPGLIVGVLAGAYSGSSFAHRLAGEALRVAFALLLVYTALRYLRAKKPEPAQAGH